MTEETLFAAALEKADPAERAAFLDAACGDDPTLRRRVEALLASHADQSFLGTPAVQRPADHQNGEETRTAPGGTDAPTCTWVGSGSEPGTVLAGRYKLLEPIGEGGMGAVWLAEQTEPVRRRVAVKLIRPGMDSRQVLARFEAERQALALMDHPNIAKVLDGGATADGRPFFVMELVKGVPLTAYCDEKRLGVRERLALFADVCRAVQHAHQKGVIHRDLKPSNVLVAPYDGKPVVKVIDFGVAKAAGQALTEKTLFTGFGAVVGTPEYMSPEQAEVNNADIDTRSDIYSLGVLLYELLTGTTPLTRQRVKEAALLEVLRLVREEEPPRPSTRLSTADGLASVAAVRGEEPGRLTRLVRGDLDWIVMKALEKDRSRRYETANGLAAEIDRYLAGEPVLAVPPSAGYRFRKFVRRNRRWLAAAGVLAAALLVAVGSVGWAVRDRDARRTEASSRVESLLADVDRDMLEGRWGDARAGLERAGAIAAGGDVAEGQRQKIDDATRELDFVRRLDDIWVETFVWTGQAFDHDQGIGKFRDAFRSFGIDVEILPTEVAADRLAGNGRITRPVAAALDRWVESYVRTTGFARPGWQPLVALASRIDPDPTRNRLRSLWGKPVTPELREEARRLADSQDAVSSGPGTMTALQLTLSWLKLGGDLERLYRRVQREHPGDFWVNFELGNWLAGTRRGDEAARYYSAALAVRPTDATVMGNLGTVLVNRGNTEEGLPLLRKAAALDVKSHRTWDSLGVALSKTGQFPEAHKCFERAIELDPTWANAHRNYGVTLLQQDKLDEAIRRFTRALELKPDEVNTHVLLAMAYRSTGKLNDSVTHFRRAVAIDDKCAAAHAGLGNAMMVLGRVKEGEESLRRALALDPNCGQAHATLGAARAGQGKLDEAIGHLRKAVEADPEDAESHCNLGSLYARLGRADAAVTEFRVAIRLRPGFLDALKYLSMMLSLHPDMRAKNPAEAAQLARRLVELAPNSPEARQLQGWEHYRAGAYRDAIRTLHESIELQKDGGDPGQWLVLAMANWQLNERDKAREWFGRAAAWLDRPNAPGDENMPRFRAEAAALLGLGTTAREQGPPPRVVPAEPKK